MASIEQKVESLLKPIIQKLDYMLYDVEYVKEGKNYFLRIYIDSPNGIDLNDCEKVNNAIIGPLDEADYIKEQYFLEVSSPGVERVLRKDEHLNQNIGKEIYIKLFKKDVNGNKEYQGFLKGHSDKEITIYNQYQENNKIEQHIERKNIALIKTLYHWE